MMKRPIWDKDINLWTEPNHLVEAHIDTLERKLNRYEDMMEKVKVDVSHPEWVDVPLENQQGIKEYIDFLELKIIEQGKVIDKYTGRTFSKVNDHIDLLEKRVSVLSKKLIKHKEKEQLIDSSKKKFGVA